MDWTGKIAISKVEAQDGGYAISFGPNVFLLQEAQNPNGMEPKVGDFIDVKVHNGLLVAGVKINDEVLFDMTEQEIEVESKKIAESADRQRRELFEQKKAELDANYQAFPEPFKARIDRFRRNNPDFRWKYEYYESSIQKAAVAIATKYPTEDGIIKFKKTPFEEQLKLVPEVYDFSGHMLAFACLLAGCYVVAPNEVVNVPGSLAQMLGIKEYG